MKNTPIEFWPEAYRRPIELHSLTQWKTAILFKHINNLNAITRWGRSAHLHFSASLLPFQPLLLLFLANQGHSIANCVCSAAMSRPSISNKEKDRSLRPIQPVFPFMYIQTCTSTNKQG